MKKILKTTNLLDLFNQGKKPTQVGPTIKIQGGSLLTSEGGTKPTPRLAGDPDDRPEILS